MFKKTRVVYHIHMSCSFKKELILLEFNDNCIAVFYPSESWNKNIRLSVKICLSLSKSNVTNFLYICIFAGKIV